MLFSLKSLQIIAFDIKLFYSCFVFPVPPFSLLLIIITLEENNGPQQDFLLKEVKKPYIPLKRLQSTHRAGIVFCVTLSIRAVN